MSADILNSKLTFSEKLCKEYHHSVKQFGSNCLQNLAKVPVPFSVTDSIIVFAASNKGR